MTGEYGYAGNILKVDLSSGNISSVPTMDPKRRQQRIILEGDVPSPINPPAGCRFHPRCPHAMDVCRREAPRELDFDGHQVRCHAVEQGTIEPPPSS